MVFALRDKNGKVDSLFRTDSGGDRETLDIDHPDVLQFLEEEGFQAVGAWRRSDLDMARVLEDLIVTLLQKELISFTDLPLDAQKKLVLRHETRGDLGFIARLFPTEDGDELGD